MFKTLVGLLILLALVGASHAQIITLGGGGGGTTVVGGSGTPGGSPGQIQYNAGGAFAGDPGMTFNDVTNVITAGGFVGPLTGNASTATALATLPTPCGAGVAATGVNASGTSVGCFTPITQASLDAHVNDTTAAHMAPSIGFTPSGSLAADDVDEALRELDTEKIPFTSVNVASGVAGLRSDVRLLETQIGSRHTHGVLSTGSGITVAALTEGIAGAGPLTDLTSTPQIVAGVAGQLALFPGVSQANTVKLDNNTGVRLCGNKGSTIVGLDNEKPLMTFNSALNVWEELICPSLQKAYNTGATIYGALDAATAVQIGTDPSTHVKIYGSTIEGLCSGAACDTILRARTGKTLLTSYSDANTPCTSMTDAGVTTYSNNCKPRKSAYFGAGYFETDGTQCTDPVSQTIVASGPKRQTIACADNDSGALYLDFILPKAWDGLALTVESAWFSATSQAGVVSTDWAFNCVSSGDAVPVDSATGALTANVSFTSVANQEARGTSAPITGNGSCVAGDHVYMKGRVRATATTAVMTNVRFLGIKVEYATNAASD